jgi:thymidylate synthase
MLYSRGVVVKLGDLTMNVGSQHIYERDVDKLREIIIDPEPDVVPFVVGDHFESNDSPDAFLSNLHILAVSLRDRAKSERGIRWPH